MLTKVAKTVKMAKTDIIGWTKNHPTEVSTSLTCLPAVTVTISPKSYPSKKKNSETFLYHTWWQKCVT
jgi:hypothetical protein